MLDWLLLTAGGAAIYAASKLIRLTRRSATKASQQTAGKVGQPLKVVVAQCEAGWFLQDLKVAMSGDVEAMIRVSHMLMAGYGTKQDHGAAAAWMRQAWAIQNYKEPAVLHDMLDVRGSDIPALNDAVNRQATPAAMHSIPATCSSSSSGGSTSTERGLAGKRPTAAAAAGSSSVGHGSSSKQSGCRVPRGTHQQVSMSCSTSSTADGEQSPGASCTGRHQSQQQQQQQQRKRSYQASSCVAQQQPQQQQQQDQQALLPVQQTSRLRKQMFQQARSRQKVQLHRVAAAVLAGAGHQPIAAAAGATATTACHAVG